MTIRRPILADDLNLPLEVVTLADRVAAFQRAYPGCPDSWPYVSPSGRWLYGTWEVGNDYRGTSTLYGAYPPRFLAKLMALFPDIAGGDVLHAFSGSLPAGPYVRLDLNAERGPDVVGNVYDARVLFGTRRFRLVIADPPYTVADAERYGTPAVNRRLATAALAEATTPGGYLAWLDTQWPMHRKDVWRAIGKIQVWGSTGHRLRGLSLFERTS